MQDRQHRIALVSGGIKVGGATTFLLNLGGELVKRGVPVLVISLEHEDPYAADFERLKIPLLIEDERKNIFEDRVLAAINRIRNFDPSIVVAALGPSSYEILRYVPSGVARLAMLQSDFPDGYAMLARYAIFASGFIGVSRAIASQLSEVAREHGLAVFCLPYGIALPNNFVRQTRAADEALRILYLGRLCREQKRVNLFPQIFAELKKARISFQWTIAGDGPELSILRAMMKPTSNALVRFTGAIAYSEVPSLLKENDIFLLASDHEGLPLSLLEAMAYGLVPVTSDLPSGVREVVDETNGALINITDVAGYARAIVRLAQDRHLLARQSAAARQKIDHAFSVEAMADRWLSVFDTLSPRGDAQWPERFRVSGPIGSNPLWFNEPMRTVRRLVKKLSQR